MKIKTVNIDSDVEKVLREAKLEGNNLTLQSQLDRSMYTKVIGVLEQIGFKWNKKLKCHVGEGDSSEQFMQALDEGKVVNAKQTYQFFATPDAICDKLVGYADIQAGHFFLEPSAGKGAIVKAVHRLADAPHIRFFAIELDPKNVAELQKLDYLNVAEGDFLKHKQMVDRIVMNPPFSQDQAIRHVKHAYDLLSPGGRLVAIMDKGWMFGANKTRREFKEWYEGMQSDGFASVPEELPPGTFKDSGTNVGAILVIISKR
jgi:phospholipid N-methyltransferase